MTADRRLLLSAALALCLTLPLSAQDQVDLIDNSGAYLAARHAENARDFSAASDWFSKALAAAPLDPRLLTGQMLSQMALGRFEEAAVSAETLGEVGKDNPSVALVLFTAAAAAGDYAGILELLSGGYTTKEVVDGMIAGWAEFGQGRMTEALAQFDTLAKTPGLEPIGHYMKALALASAGDLEGADGILSGPDGASITTFRRGILAHIQILSQLERNADALGRLETVFGNQLDPELADLRRRLTAGEPIPFTAVNGALHGMAEALFTFAAAASEHSGAETTLAFARAALHLRPGDSDFTLLVAETYEALGQQNLAAETYALIAEDDPSRHLAEIGRATALYAVGNTDEAIAGLVALTQSHPDLVQAHLALGDMLRRQERYEEALAAYDAGIALVSGPAPWAWPLHYNRGICLERLDRFAEGIPSFRQALALNPGQPQVLNYLGYTWIDRGENLAEAVQMIEEAVKAAPDQGYIIDSLAWAYYRLGRFADALAPMERASLLEPVDAIVTDHLGDIYWVNDRKEEAQFQWRRALSFDPTEKDAIRIREKLEKGLDAVLEQEKAGDGTSD